MLRRALLAAAALTATAAVAQTGPVTQQSAVRANDQAAMDDASRQQAQAMGNMSRQQQYEADLAAYQSSVARHDANADMQDAHYRHQQRAYADAMSAWRRQVYACHHGSSRACNAPSPDPANYW